MAITEAMGRDVIANSIFVTMLGSWYGPEEKCHHYSCNAGQLLANLVLLPSFQKWAEHVNGGKEAACCLRQLSDAVDAQE